MTSTNPNGYDLTVLADTPAVYWNDASLTDATGHGVSAMAVGSPGTTALPDGSEALEFNGISQYAEAASHPLIAIPAQGSLTIEAWVRPDVLDFVDTEGSGYVYWFGKSTVSGHHEYAGRIYGQHPTGNDALRINRMTGHLFASDGSTTVGSYYQPAADYPLAAGEWLHYVLVVKTTGGTGGTTKLTVHRRSPDGTIQTFEDSSTVADLVTSPGAAPLRIGTRNLQSYFAGAVGKVAIYSYELPAARSLAHVATMFGYDAAILEDRPVAYWPDASLRDYSGNGHHGTLVQAPGTSSLPNGDQTLVLNGVNQYGEVPSHPELSVPTAGVLTLEAWLRPDVLDFPHPVAGRGYVHWMGKGSSGQYEYAARMYSYHLTAPDTGRSSRISGYAYNLGGDLGAGSYYQDSGADPIAAGEWIHYVLTINTTAEAIAADPVRFPTGYTRILVHRRAADGTIQTFSDQDALIDYGIVPGLGSSPFRIGTDNTKSYFKGAIGKVALYAYELSEETALNHAVKMLE